MFSKKPPMNRVNWENKQDLLRVRHYLSSQLLEMGKMNLRLRRFFKENSVYIFSFSSNCLLLSLRPYPVMKILFCGVQAKNAPGYIPSLLVWKSYCKGFIISVLCFYVNVPSVNKCVDSSNQLEETCLIGAYQHIVPMELLQQAVGINTK